jgi:GNAT superfamily N-acetyltransferase
MALIKLTPEDYGNVSAIIGDLNRQVVLGSIIAGNTQGDVYADDPEVPAWAILWNKMDAVLVVGDKTNPGIDDLEGMLSGVFRPDADRRGVPCFRLYYPDASWDPALADRLRPLNPGKRPRFYFGHDGASPDRIGIVGEDCILKRIDGNLLQANDQKNLEKVHGWIRSFWPNPGRFLDHGLGYGLVRDGAVVSWCLSVFVNGPNFEFGLETVKEYRGRGYAKAVASACVRDCLERGLTPVWNCDADNAPSARVAEAVGFKRIKEYEVWRIPVF